MPDSHCERCIALERQQRDLEIEVEEQKAKQHAGFHSDEDLLSSQNDLVQKVAILNETKLIYDLHRRRVHGSGKEKTLSKKD